MQKCSTPFCNATGGDANFVACGHISKFIINSFVAKPEAT